MASYLITGASRGLGLELTRLLAALPASEVSKVFATARKDSSKLNELAEKFPGRIIVVKAEVTDRASVEKAAVAVETSLAGRGLDVLINNAGIMPFTPEGTTEMHDLQAVFANNVLSVHIVTQAFLPLLRKGNLKKVASISSILGSIALAPNLTFVSAPAYKVSKAALNALTVQYATDLKKDDFIVFALHPGICFSFPPDRWLRTELGGEAADLSVEEGGKASLDKILGAGKEQNGTFMSVYVKGSESYDGANLPW